jgi:DNA segregation ATPase FtsK/SpoIIIE, S-DNA-T family
LLKAREFKTAASQLTIALGKDIAGRPVWADLALMPHLLIAGATGTGKSVSIHAMLASILFKATANDVRFILIDHLSPKRVQPRLSPGPSPSAPANVGYPRRLTTPTFWDLHNGFYWPGIGPLRSKEVSGSPICA